MVSYVIYHSEQSFLVKVTMLLQGNTVHHFLFCSLVYSKTKEYWVSNPLLQGDHFLHNRSESLVHTTRNNLDPGTVEAALCQVALGH